VVDPVVIKRLLDIGFFNFLIPFIDEEMARTPWRRRGTRGWKARHRAAIEATSTAT
jgi:2-dehydro-3-deoxyglucarate aldolase